MLVSMIPKAIRAEMADNGISLDCSRPKKSLGRFRDPDMRRGFRALDSIDTKSDSTYEMKRLQDRLRCVLYKYNAKLGHNDKIDLSEAKVSLYFYGFSKAIVLIFILRHL